MHVSARPATLDDLPHLVRLYGLLEEEMVALSPLWPAASGLLGDPEEALASMIRGDHAVVAVGVIGGVITGFCIGVEEAWPATGEPMVAIRFIFTERPAREVGVAKAAFDHVVGAMEERGHTLFDAHVLPGHRLAKNFFESNGFKARHIVMHRK